MMEHLHKSTREFIIGADDKDRIELAKKSKWVGYTAANSIRKELIELLEYPRVERMPSILLVGDSNNGKTAMLNKFMKDVNTRPIRNPDEFRVSVLFIQAPPEPDEKRFYNAILERLFAPYRSSEKIEMRQQRVIDLLRKVDLKMLVVDEIHHVLAGTMAKQRTFLNVLKFLSNELRISLVCSGTRDAFNAIQTDPQLANRFNPKILKKWRNDTEYLRLLSTYEQILPLKEVSHLIEGSLSTKILTMSEGLIGEVSKILELSTILAIKSGIEKINSSVLDNIDYTPPSERKKMLHKL